ncbi:MAG: hypothetical protein ACPGJI_00990 [Kangiellaceae bacterium]
MCQTINQISDNDFIEQFENKTLDPRYFNHIGHLRLAWLYLNTNNLQDAIQTSCFRIKAYATSLGATTKFNTTITSALLEIMNKRMKSTDTGSWELFLQQNRDLVNDALSILSQHYSIELIFSEQARLCFVEPDLSPF